MKGKELPATKQEWLWVFLLISSALKAEHITTRTIQKVFERACKKLVWGKHNRIYRQIFDMNKSLKIVPIQKLGGKRCSPLKH